MVSSDELTEQSVAGLMPLISQLADGNVHSGETLGNALGISRTAIWKQLKKLEALGLMVNSIKGLGYQLVAPLDLLNIESIRNASKFLSEPNINLEVKPCIDSTNTFTASRLRSAPFKPSTLLICAAEAQTQGRGRRGRAWISPFASNLYFSLGFQASESIAQYEGLSLAVGTVIVSTLNRELAVSGLSLKWPNDVLYAGKKLAGILIEVDGDLAGSCNLVIGVGINYSMTSDQSGAINQPWVDLQQIARQQQVQLPGRSQLLAKLLDNMVELVSQYHLQGFKYYRQRWQDLDSHYQKAVSVHTGAQEFSGIGQGVDDSGALQVLVDGELKSFSGGEVSLRGAP